jgi:hypothetical protein
MTFAKWNLGLWKQGRRRPARREDAAQTFRAFVAVLGRLEQRPRGLAPRAQRPGRG